MRASIVLLVLVSALAMLEQTSSIQCYDCNTHDVLDPNDPYCKNPEMKNCGSSVRGCVKGAGKDKNGTPGVVRGCARFEWEKESNYCMDGTNGRLCYCKSDLCNAGDISGSSNRPAALGLFLVLLLVFV
ncbi:hypothetical protein M3Y94_00990100 [Aphelenchoides besseyi]|nr:hypothetical protein M3Y94_00990100 [Aphelenchoides besseyi]